MIMDAIPTNLPPRKLRANLSIHLPNGGNNNLLGIDIDEVYSAANDDDDDDDDDDEYFKMYDFKVRRCSRARSHDWTECPFAHPGEKARRRDPRKYHYSGTICADYRIGGSCPRGDSCAFAHGVFESWLHPAKYRTAPCRDGSNCSRKVCFFAHNRRQLRAVQPSSPPSLFLSPTSTLVGLGSPPVVKYCGAVMESRRRKGLVVGYEGELMRRLEEMEISPAVTGSMAMMMNESGGGGGGCCAPDLEWVDELLK